MISAFNFIEYIAFGSVPAGINNPKGQDYTALGSYFHNLIASATYAPKNTGSKDDPHFECNENFHPYSAMMQATTIAFFVLWGSERGCQALPYAIRRTALTASTAATLIPLFHLFGVAINSIRDAGQGKPSIVVRDSKEETI